MRRPPGLVGWRSRERIEQAVVETRWQGRRLAALPDAITAAFLAWTWALPLEVGRDGVIGGMALVALEFSALLGLIGLFVVVRSQGLSNKLRALVPVGFGLVAVALIAQEVQRAGASLWTLLSFAWLLAAKWMVFVMAWRDGTWFAEGFRLVLQCIALMLVLSIAMDLAGPRWGFDEAAVRQLALPLQPHGSQVAGLGIQPWQLFAAGSLYFAFSAFARGLLAIRRVPAVPE